MWVTTGPAGPASGAPADGRRTGRTRWIALAAGFAVLVAVIALQHFLGGRPAGSPASGATSSAAASAAAASPATAAGTSAPAVNSTASTAAASAAVRSPTTAALSPAPSGVDAWSADSPTAASGEIGSGGSSDPDSTSPITTTIPAGALPATGTWELVGYGHDGLVRYQPATGRVIVTPIPGLAQDGPPSLVLTRSAAIIAPMNSPVGFLVPDGKPAAPMTVLSSVVAWVPGPGPNALWAATFDGTHTILLLTDPSGTPTGTKVPLPDALAQSGPYGLSSDGAGYVLASGVGGTYDVRPDGVRLVTHGTVLAVGLRSFVVYECDDAARCAVQVIDRASGTRRELPGFTPGLGFPSVGVVSADGHFAAALEFDRSGPRVALVDLTTGEVRHPAIAINLNTFTGDSTAQLAFSPDGRYLLTALDVNTGVVPVDTRTGRALPPLPLPPMSAIAVRATAG